MSGHLQATVTSKMAQVHMMTFLLPLLSSQETAALKNGGNTTPITRRESSAENNSGGLNYFWRRLNNEKTRGDQSRCLLRITPIQSM
ncbi:hypothetical protein HOY80DRAFT_542338 [Tuber brumale]|nr:hypothetical protein HOY80DRAFT_542338 [Tuber brumale]